MHDTDETRYEIRLAATEDIADLVRMQMALQRSMTHPGAQVLRLHPRSMTRLRAYYEAQIDDDLARLLVAQDCLSEAVVGMGAGRIWVHADYVPARSGELIDLWVDPDHRRQGLAKRFMTRLLAFFRANDIAFLAVNYVRGNPVAERLWTRLGFEPALATATAERRQVESALKLDSQRIVSTHMRSSADSRRLFVGIGSSG